jgi:excisionase family DNA binding protein
MRDLNRLMPDRPLFKLNEVALLLNVHIRSVQRWTTDGTLPCIRTPGNQKRVSKAALEGFLASYR